MAVGLIAPTVFDDALVAFYADNGVTSVYGKLAVDYLGGGHESVMLADVGWDRLATHIHHCRSLGLDFNYVMNSTCLGLSEFDNDQRANLFRFLDQLCDAGVSSVTVSNPNVVQLVKTNYTDVSVKVSACAYVKSVGELKYWEGLGADVVVLDPLQVNRDFRTLRGIARVAKAELELIVNNNCFQYCPEIYNHQNFLSHSSSQSLDAVVEHDYSYNWCSHERLREPANYLIADWIRPEDLVHYEGIGYHRFKITDRNTPVEYLRKRVTAYHSRRYDGNLLDLIQHFAYRDDVPPEEYLAEVYIDNRKLDDYIKMFLRSDCKAKDCGGSCRYCFEYADEVITFQPGFAERHLERKRRINELKNSRNHTLQNATFIPLPQVARVGNPSQ
jgi:collagenase-like PrtC family protease